MLGGGYSEPHLPLPIDVPVEVSARRGDWMATSGSLRRQAQAQVKDAPLSSFAKLLFLFDHWRLFETLFPTFEFPSVRILRLCFVF